MRAKELGDFPFMLLLRQTEIFQLIAIRWRMTIDRFPSFSVYTFLWIFSCYIFYFHQQQISLLREQIEAVLLLLPVLHCYICTARKIGKKRRGDIYHDKNSQNLPNFVRGSILFREREEREKNTPSSFQRTQQHPPFDTNEMPPFLESHILDSDIKYQIKCL